MGSLPVTAPRATRDGTSKRIRLEIPILGGLFQLQVLLAIIMVCTCYLGLLSRPPNTRTGPLSGQGIAMVAVLLAVRKAIGPRPRS